MARELVEDELGVHFRLSAPCSYMEYSANLWGSSRRGARLRRRRLRNARRGVETATVGNMHGPGRTSGTMQDRTGR